jgi:hypothetical protein
MRTSLDRQTVLDTTIARLRWAGNGREAGLVYQAEAELAGSRRNAGGWRAAWRVAGGKATNLNGSYVSNSP